MMALNKYFDHTLLKPDATDGQIKALCQEAREYDFYSVCINSCHVNLAAKELAGCHVEITAVVGFPLGACTTKTKAFETEEACRAGASEIDMVINVGKLKSGDYDYVLADIEKVVDAASEYGSIVKVILETGLLTTEEIVKSCQLAAEGGAHFVKTSTGFCGGGATTEAVQLMKQTVGSLLKIKASGGIRDYETARKMIEAGADRLGASASVEIMKQAETK